MKKVLPNYPKLPKSLYLIDSHCHLDMEVYQDNLSDIIQLATSHGVRKIFTIGIDVASSRRAIDIAKKHSDVFATIGIHPHETDDLNDNDYRELRSLHNCNPDTVIGYGEIGLDYVKEHSSPINQRLHFAKQLDLASELQLPIIVHNREADSDTLKILNAKQGLPHGGVMHCFSGNYNFAKRIIDMGMYISIPGIVTFKNATTLHEVVKHIPLENMLVETDGPFLSPHPYRGKRNEPVNVLFTAAKIAEIKGIELQEVARQTTLNAKKLFQLN